jgi:CBS domain containing-hemolysin-like protein
MEILLILLLVVLFFVVFFWFLLLPASIAEKRGVSSEELTTIKVLCWCSLLLGITWLVALVLALVWQPQKWTDKDKGKTNIDLDGLEKLYNLKKKGVITKAEFDREKKKLMGK